MNNSIKQYAFFLCIAISSPLHAEFLKGLTSWFSGQEELSFYKEESLSNDAIIELDNFNGSVAIKTWSVPKIALEATKIGTESDVEAIIIDTEITGKKALIKSTATNDGNKGSVNYSLIVPAHATLNIKTGNGSVKIKNVKGAITATTQKGTIDILNASQSVKAEATGNVSVTCSCIPLNSSIALKSGHHISLTCPRDTHAYVSAKTGGNGVVTSDHYVTLKSLTVKLNQQTWKRFKQEVTGMLGNGGASIKLESDSGNIKILEIY